MFKWSMTIDYFVRFYVLSLPQYPPPKVPSLAWNVDVVESLEGVVPHTCGGTTLALWGPIFEEAIWEML
jgi:hypothetical protein